MARRSHLVAPIPIPRIINNEIVAYLDYGDSTSTPPTVTL